MHRRARRRERKERSVDAVMAASWGWLQFVREAEEEVEVRVVREEELSLSMMVVTVVRVVVAVGCEKASVVGVVAMRVTGKVGAGGRETPATVGMM